MPDGMIQTDVVNLPAAVWHCRDCGKAAPNAGGQCSACRNYPWPAVVNYYPGGRTTDQPSLRDDVAWEHVGQPGADAAKEVADQIAIREMAIRDQMAIPRLGPHLDPVIHRVLAVDEYPGTPTPAELDEASRQLQKKWGVDWDTARRLIQKAQDRRVLNHEQRLLDKIATKAEWGAVVDSHRLAAQFDTPGKRSIILPP